MIFADLNSKKNSVSLGASSVKLGATKNEVTYF